MRSCTLSVALLFFISMLFAVGASASIYAPTPSIATAPPQTQHDADDEHHHDEDDEDDEDHHDDEDDDADEAIEVDPLQQMREEQQELSTEYQLRMQRQKNELQHIDLEKQAIAAESSLRKLHMSEAMAEMQMEMERMKMEMGFHQTRLEVQLADAKREIARLSTERQLMDAERNSDLQEINGEMQRLGAENNLLAQRMKRMQLQGQMHQLELQQEQSEISGMLSLAETRQRLSDQVIDDVNYRDDPFRDGTLHISDRRISLNGPIYSGVADRITERIHFFNNKSRDLPIFLVIDNCPGGSVMEGYRIVKAIEESPATVHVVVKSFAASMAAVITTLAPESYAYPNAIILHHQMSSGMSGNLTQQEEQLENGHEWARRLADPVADKMGVSYERLVEMMYDHNSDGDWAEFADDAVDMNWVNDIVHEIREDGIREHPGQSSGGGLPFFFQAEEETDDFGNRFVRLPRLSPYDHWFLHNPDGYFRY